ncbi:MAG: DUF2807 domain-containing protein [Bacteroidetes bacterium]|nr:DUF2807 domain-containing protein [Bacteroidota bacterium]
MKIRILIGVVSLLMISFLISSCEDCIRGNGNVTTKKIKVGDITNIRFSGDANIVLVKDSTDQISITGESNIIDLYEFDESGNSLKIKSSKCILGHETVTIRIPVKTIESLTLNGSGNFSSENMLKGGDVDLDLNGSGDFNLQLEAENVVGHINGSGNIILKGSSRNERMQINGSGDVDAAEFASGQVKVTINGSGDCKVLATNSLDVVVRGSGNVYYKGSPDVTTEIKGSGTVGKLN